MKSRRRTHPTNYTPAIECLEPRILLAHLTDAYDDGGPLGHMSWSDQPEGPATIKVMVHPHLGSPSGLGQRLARIADAISEVNRQGTGLQLEGPTRTANPFVQAGTIHIHDMDSITGPIRCASDLLHFKALACADPSIGDSSQLYPDNHSLARVTKGEIYMLSSLSPLGTPIKWYLGDNPGGIATTEYDYQSVVLHEIGHLLGLDHSGDSGYTFEPGSPMARSITLGITTRSFQAHDRAAFQHLYASSYIIDSQGKLFTVDVRNGTTVYGGSTLQMNDIAFDSSGQLYGISAVTHQAADLYKINTTTGATTLVGSLGVYANSLVTTSNGVIYAAGGNRIYRVRTATGSAIEVLATRYESAGDLEFDANGDLYVTTRSGHLIRVNPSLTTWTVIGQTGITYFWGLIYGPDKVMYGFAGNEIRKINLTNGATTPVAVMNPINVKTVYGAATYFRRSFGVFSYAPD